jgi:UDP-glucose:glycoprotein glucosyltransferase
MPKGCLSRCLLQEIGTMRNSTREQCESLAIVRVTADQYRSFTVGDSDTAILHIAATLDPVSEEAQRWSDLLAMFAKMENVAITVYLDPDVQPIEVSRWSAATSDTDDMQLKLKRFYRSVMPSKLSFDVDG